MHYIYRTQLLIIVESDQESDIYAAVDMRGVAVLAFDMDRHRRGLWRAGARS